jgi:hypothetical protein
MLINHVVGPLPNVEIVGFFHRHSQQPYISGYCHEGNHKTFNLCCAFLNACTVDCLLQVIKRPCILQVGINIGSLG